MEYYYDSFKDTDEAKYYKNPWVRIVLLLMFGAVFYFLSWPKTIKEILFFIALVITPIFLTHYLMKPKKDFISFKNGTLSWKFQKDKNSIDLNSMTGLKENSNNLLFTTSTGNTQIFPSHNIESREKYDELVGILKKRFNK